MSSIHPKKWLVLLGVSIAAIMLPIDYSIVNTCLGLIQHDLQMSMSELQWIMTGFGITFCAPMAALGRLADILGRRKLNYIGCVGFGLASLGAGFATSPGMLITMRVLQGLFGAIMFPTGSAMIADAFPKEEQSKALGIYGACMGIGIAIGPVLGSLITTFLSWRWIFFVNIPIILISFLICLPVLRESKYPSKTSIDWSGAFFLILSLASIVFAVSMGRNYGWLSPMLISAYILALVSSLLLVRAEKTAQDPLLPFHLFTNHGFQASAWTYGIAVGLAWVVIFLTPLFLQVVMGLSTAQTGLMLIPMTAMTILFPGVSGNLYAKYGAIKVILLIFLTSITGFGLLLFLNSSTPYLYLIFAFIVYGASWGMGNGVGTPLAISELENNNDVGVVSGASITILNISGIVFLALCTMIFSYVESGFLNHLLQQTAITLSPAQIHAVQVALSQPDHAAAILSQVAPQHATQLLTLFRAAFAGTYNIVMGILLVITLIALPFTLCAAKNI